MPLLSHYKTGKTHPFLSLIEYPSPYTVTTQIIFNSASFDILHCIPKVNKYDISDWKHVLIECGIFVDEDIPFLAFRFGNHQIYTDKLSFSVPLYIRLISNAYHWLDTEDYVVNLYLISANDRKVKAIRVIDLSWEASVLLKATCRLGYYRYKNINQMVEMGLTSMDYYTQEDLFYGSYARHYPKDALYIY